MNRNAFNRIVTVDDVEWAEFPYVKPDDFAQTYWHGLPFRVVQDVTLVEWIPLRNWLRGNLAGRDRDKRQPV